MQTESNIELTSLTTSLYLIYNMLVIHFVVQSYRESDILEARPTTEFQWIDIENLTEFRACRNSIQGASLIVDERGKNIVIIWYSYFSILRMTGYELATVQSLTCITSILCFLYIVLNILFCLILNCVLTLYRGQAARPSG